MDIYEIGEEKCVDGVWGREVNGRFYTYYFKHNNYLALYRKVDVDNRENDWFVSLNVGAYLESVTCIKQSWLTQYVPKHIKDLENLKRGDIVWSKISTSHGEMWVSTRFVKKIQDNYITTNVFDNEGNVAELHTSSYKVIYLKPPFDI